MTLESHSQQSFQQEHSGGMATYPGPFLLLLQIALFCKSRWCQALDSSLKHAQCLNDEGLVSLASRPQPVWKCLPAGGQHDHLLWVVASSTGLSVEMFLSFLAGRKRSICTETSCSFTIANTLTRTRCVPFSTVVSTGAFRRNGNLAWPAFAAFTDRSFCKRRWCQALDSSLKHAQCLNDEGLVSLASRPQPVWKCLPAGGQHDHLLWVVASSTGLSVEMFLSFLAGRKRSICTETSCSFTIANTLTRTRCVPFSTIVSTGAFRRNGNLAWPALARF